MVLNMRKFLKIIIVLSVMNNSILCAETTKEKVEKNIEYYKNEILKNPNNPDLYRALGSFYLLNLKYEDAESNIKKAIEIRKSTNDADISLDYEALGILYKTEKKYKEAEDYFKKSIEIEPDERDVYYRLADFYKEIKNYDKAIKTYQKAISIMPYDSLSFTDLGEMYEVMGNKREAINNYEKALENLVEYQKKYQKSNDDQIKNNPYRERIISKLEMLKGIK